MHPPLLGHASLLPPPATVLKEFDRMQAGGELWAALTVLTFGELFKLCERVAPAEVRGRFVVAVV